MAPVKVSELAHSSVVLFKHACAAIYWVNGPIIWSESLYRFVLVYARSESLYVPKR